MRLEISDYEEYDVQFFVDLMRYPKEDGPRLADLANRKLTDGLVALLHQYDARKYAPIPFFLLQSRLLRGYKCFTILEGGGVLHSTLEPGNDRAMALELEFQGESVLMR
jgi:hypothetical protein